MHEKARTRRTMWPKISDSTTRSIEKVIFQLLMHASEVQVAVRIVVARKASIGIAGILSLFLFYYPRLLLPR